ncbi:polysaccharide lyase 8 family protein [Kitasatospora sp. NPDC056446]|uniref:polysaccharide lyase 8 family protein n=1 Tax=Kitasatospora sp. NPDC056446 TaxID=3345819 RepID=UPI0036AB9A18
MPADESDEYAELRARWTGLMLGRGFSPTEQPFKYRLSALGKEAHAHHGTMLRTPGALWSDLDFTATHDARTRSSRMCASYRRLRIMAEAFVQPGTGHTGAADLLDAVLYGLRHLNSAIYNPSTPAGSENWWDWQIGAPQHLLDTCVLLHPHIAAEQLHRYGLAVDHFVTDAKVDKSTGANRVDLCRVLVLRGIVGEQPEKIARGAGSLSPVFPYVTSGDGLYADGSLIQHGNVPYTGTFGQVLLDGLARLFALLDGSRWAVTDPLRQNVHDAVDRCFAPCLHDGLVMDHVSGRAISRQGGSDHGRGHSLIAAIVLLAESEPAADRARRRAMAKGWLLRDTWSDPLNGLGIDALSLIKPLLFDGTGPAEEPVGHTILPAMDRAVHRRPQWTVTVSMSSQWITYYETGYKENLRGWHTGQGMLYTWVDGDGLGQYADAFWPTVDPYRLPGTTVSRKKLADGYPGPWHDAAPGVRWVGGATDGTYAAVGQNIRGLNSTLQAKKSWFFLDDCVVCLGAGIRASGGELIDTVVENRNLGEHGSRTFTAGDGTVLTGPFPPRTLPGTRWAHLSGHGGYVFIGGVNLQAAWEKRTGAWHDINHGGSTTPVSREYLTLHLAHGTPTRPEGSDYAYVLLPGATADTAESRAKKTDSWLKLAANNEKQQAVTVPALGLRAVNFWFGGTVGPLTATAPACVLVREVDGTGTLCVSDPKRTGDTFDLTWDRAVTEVISRDPAIEVLHHGTSLTLRVTPGTAGATHRCVARLAPQ